MKKFSSKRALLLSLLSMVICVSMLVGSTFAWFTDSAAANVNTIQSGDLNVELVGADGNPLTTALKWVKATGHEGETVLWEPGCKYSLEGFKIKNAGNLALKYKVVITGLTGDAKLLEAIDFTVSVDGDALVAKDGESTATTVASLNNFEGTLEAGKSTGLITITGKMKETAGNEFKGLSIDGIKIAVYATQLAHESDSTRTDYDERATYYPVIDAAGFKSAIKAGGMISINESFSTSASDKFTRTTINLPTTIDLNATITVPGSLEDSMNWAALFINADTTINASNGGGINCANKTDASASYAGGPFVANIGGEGITVTVNGGTYYGGGTTFQVAKGTLVINGGFFSVYPDIGTNDYRYVLNCIDANYNNGTANIIVKGGTFVNFDPSNNAAEGAGTNFVADGYTVISEAQANGDVWYTVVKEGAEIYNADSVESLKTIAGNVKSGDIVRLTSDLTISETITFEASGFTFDGNGHTITAAMSDADVEGLKTILRFGHDSTYCKGVTVKNVTFNGKGGRAMHFHGGSVSTLENVNIYGEWSLAINFYGTHGAVMTNCNISSSYANKYAKGTIFANEQSANQIVLKGTTIDSMFVNATEKGATYANNGIKVVVGSGSTVNEIHTNEGITRTFVTIDGGTVGSILADIK